MALSEQTITVNEHSVHYWEDGQQNGRALLLLHGGLGDAAANWRGVMPMLADTFRALAPDLPGFGKSADLPAPTPAAMMNWIRSFLDELDVEQAVVVGSSFGALFARLFAAAEPQYVPAVILVNGGTIPDIPPAFGLLARLPVIGSLLFSFIGRSASSLNTLRRMIYVQDILTDDFLKSARTNAPRFARLMQMAAAYGMPEKHNPIVPTLLLWGIKDQIVTLEEGKRIQAGIPGAKFSEIDECGHMPQLEAPEVFVWQIKQYLEQLSRPPRLAGAGRLPQTPPGG